MTNVPRVPQVVLRKASSRTNLETFAFYARERLREALTQLMLQLVTPTVRRQLFFP